MAGIYGSGAGGVTRDRLAWKRGFTFAGSVLNLMLALGGASFLALVVLLNGAEDKLALLVRGSVLVVPYVVGLAMAFFNIYRTYNLLMPPLLRVFIFISVLGTCLLYVYVMLRMQAQTYGFEKYVIYLMMLVGSQFAAWGMFFVLEDERMPSLYSGMLYAACMAHLLLIVMTHVFSPTLNVLYLVADFFLLMVMFALAGVMAWRNGPLTRMKVWREKLLGLVFPAPPEGSS